MADYYANINNVYTGTGHAGTEEDPFSWTDLIIHAAANSGNVYNIKGMLNNDFGDLHLQANIWKGWNIAINGPYRIRKTSIASMWITGLTYIKDAIMVLPDADFFNLPAVYNCAFNCEGAVATSFESGGIGLVHKGCTFFNCVTIGGIYTDCLIYETKEEADTYNNCAIAIASMKDPTYNDCQFNWSMPAAPAWDADQSAWNAAVLAAGVTTPPQPGNPPYTGYETGLWGEARTGIGAVYFAIPKIALNYFSDSTVADGIYVTSYINTSKLITTIQSDSTDTYFDSTSEIGKVIVYYAHEDNRQLKRIFHTREEDSTNLIGQTMWSAHARDGIWQKTRIKAYDRDGAYHELGRSAIGTGEDTTHASGNIYLNIS